MELERKLAEKLRDQARGMREKKDHQNDCPKIVNFA
jgi:hypothetical protein